MAVHFSPARNVLYTDNFGRELEFTQASNGDVSVRVYYGSNPINKLFQNNIFFRRDMGPLRTPVEKSLADPDITPYERKVILQAITNALERDAILDERSVVYLEIENDIGSGIIHRNTGRELLQARQITVVLK